MLKLNDKTFDKYVADDVPLLVMFHAAFSGPCKLAFPNFQEAAGRRGNRVRFATFDLDGNPDVPERYGLKGVPLFIYFEGGKPQNHTLGALNVEQIIELIPEESD